MTPEVRQWVEGRVVACAPVAPVLEVGSYDVNGGVRDLFPQPYTGLDMRAGPGVDVVADITNGWKSEEEFQTVVCLDMLEHCESPQAALTRMYAVMADGGRLLAAAPMAWAEHNHPADYWRFTQQGMRLMLTRAGFRDIAIEQAGDEVLAEAWKRRETARLDLGAGAEKAPGWIAVDVVPYFRPHIWGTMTNLPFADGSVDELLAAHVLEHFEPKDRIPVMNEMWRVLKPGGTVHIEVPLFPYWTAIADPTHVSMFVVQSFAYFTTAESYRRTMGQAKSFGDYRDHQELYGIKVWEAQRAMRDQLGSVLALDLVKPCG